MLSRSKSAGKKQAFSTTREKEKLGTINQWITAIAGAAPRLGLVASTTVTADQVMRALAEVVRYILSHFY